jgi:hypothetical protein
MNMAVVEADIDHVLGALRLKRIPDRPVAARSTRKRVLPADMREKGLNPLSGLNSSRAFIPLAENLGAQYAATTTSGQGLNTVAQRTNVHERFLHPD